jgi:GntR family transcriptional repressor for pyruvate dehydrogenase complex
MADRAPSSDVFSASDEEDSQAWAPVRATSVSSKIVGQVRDALFTDRLKPGDHLGSEKELSLQFGVSRITVRDALRTLEATGIVEIRVGAGGGARIANGNLDHFSDSLAIQFKLSDMTAREIIEAQMAIEGAGAELAAKNRTEEDLQRLEELVAEARIHRDNSPRFLELGMVFHLAFAEASRNRALVAQFKALRHVIWPKGGGRPTGGSAQNALKVHEKLIELLRARDGAGARALMCEHLEEIRSVAFADEADKAAN